jgi:hypothetical protein
VAIAAWAFEGAEGVPFDAIVILAIIVLNAVLGYVQEARAEEAVSALPRMAAPTAGVRRDGRPQRMPTTELVPGDVLLLPEGDAASADGRLVEAASLMVADLRERAGAQGSRGVASSPTSACCSRRGSGCRTPAMRWPCRCWRPRSCGSTCSPTARPRWHSPRS